MELKTMQVQVKRVTYEASDIKSFELGYADGSCLPPYQPGSHIDVHVGDGIVRQYSLCNGPHDTCSYLIAVKKEPASRGGNFLGKPLHIGRFHPDASCAPIARESVRARQSAWTR